jgi:hypothetical protein
MDITEIGHENGDYTELTGENPVAGFCEHGSESSISLQYRKLLDEPN